MSKTIDRTIKITKKTPAVAKEKLVVNKFFFAHMLEKQKKTINNEVPSHSVTFSPLISVGKEQIFVEEISKSPIISSPQGHHLMVDLSKMGLGQILLLVHNFKPNEINLKFLGLSYELKKILKKNEILLKKRLLAKNIYISQIKLT